MPANVPGFARMPEAAPGPGLENGHEHEEDPGRTGDDPPQALTHPGPVGQGDEASGDYIEQDSPRRTEENGEARGEDPPERFAEDPDDEPPADAPQSGEARPPAARGDEEEHPDAQLDPHGCGGGRRRVPGPRLGAEIDQANHPVRGAGRSWAQDGGRHVERHGLLQLQETIDNPERPEAESEESTRRGLRRGGRARWGVRSSVRHSPAVLLGPQGVPGHEEENQKQENDQALVRQRRVELSDDRRVTRARSASHSRHQVSASTGPVVTPMAVTLPSVGRKQHCTPVAGSNGHTAALPPRQGHLLAPRVRRVTAPATGDLLKSSHARPSLLLLMRKRSTLRVRPATPIYVSDRGDYGQTL
jgi:hypothetical protein